mmetsp:Transcript_22306/g.22620  ORF Transcript_22306/g.22620 Transcript_22306/m.22620 type:complete len:95 (-) Transcript_22306:119-403(-)
MTMDPKLLLSGESPLAEKLKSVTVIYLYTYPTLLMRLIPLLALLTDDSQGFTKCRAIATLTYHIPDDQVLTTKIDQENDIRVYSRVFDTKENDS